MATEKQYAYYIEGNKIGLVEKNVSFNNNVDSIIDLPSYLCKALVYYVKGRLAEDSAELEARQYFMREFKKILEKHESGKIRGPRVISPGSHSIR